MTPAATNQRASRAARTTCRHGHDLTDPSNVLPDSRYVGCRTCKREQNRRADARRRAVAASSGMVRVELVDAPTLRPGDDGKRYEWDEWKRLFGAQHLPSAGMIGTVRYETEPEWCE